MNTVEFTPQNHRKPQVFNVTMNRTEESSEWQPVPPGLLLKVFRARKRNPYESSLIGEYVRLLLLLAASPLLIWFTYADTCPQTGVLPPIATCLLLASLVTQWGFPLMRATFLLAMSTNVYLLVNTRSETLASTNVNPSSMPYFVLLFCLVIASIFETSAWIRFRLQKRHVPKITDSNQRD